MSASMPSDKEVIKSAMRESRLKATHRVDDIIREEWRKQAFGVCENFTRAYWVCRQEQGMMVVFKCREENAKMKDCLNNYMLKEEEFGAYRDKRLLEMAEAKKAAAKPAPV